MSFTDTRNQIPETRDCFARPPVAGKLAMTSRRGLQKTPSLRGGQRPTKQSLFWLLVTGFWFLFSPLSFAGEKALPEVLNDLPVQSGGRVKPFDSFAKETLVSITGDRELEGVQASEVLWQWMTRPEEWSTKPMIPVAFRPLREEFSKMLVNNRLTPEILLNHAPFVEKTEAAIEKDRKKEKLTQLERERIHLYEKAYLFQQIGKGEMPGWIANPEDPRAGWFALRGLADEADKAFLYLHYPAEKVETVRTSVQLLMESLHQGTDSSAITKNAEAFQAALSELFESRGIHLDRKVLKQEKIYHRLRPFSWAWKFYLAALLLFVTAGSLPRLKAPRNDVIASLPARGRRAKQSQNQFLQAFIGTGVGVFTVGFLIHAYGFYLRCAVAGRPPVSNMYESIIWVSWAVCFFSLILFSVYRAPVILAASGTVSTLALLIAESFPAVLDPTISPLVPVLRSTLWLSVHVLTITMSYGAFALAWGLGHVVVAGFVFAPENQERNRILAQYLYRALQIGVILLATGTVLGGVWANYSWGRFWGWDPKETWALIALLGYLAVLHGRFAGWLGIFGLAVGAIYAFAGVVMAWYGVNYVLAAGLHSYGFGGGGAVYVLGFVLLDMALIGWMAYHYKNSRLQKLKA